MERIDVLAALSTVSGVRYEHISELNINPVDCLSAEWWEQVGFRSTVAQAIVKSLSLHDPEEYRRSLQALGCQAVGVGDAMYPRQLLQTYNPPLVIYVQGELRLDPGLALVGTRKATPYGRQVIEALTPVLVEAGLPVVSGLAVGIDTLAHVVALRCGGYTIAVLGSGFDHIYPITNKNLAARIVDSGGALLTEYRPGTKPQKHHFPARNRIISGLCSGVIVVEGDKHSGALITAEHAMEQGRDVFAVPGSIFSSQSRGPNELIAQGAIPLISPSILIEHYNLKVNDTSQDEELTAEESSLLKAIGHNPTDIDQVALNSGLHVTIVAAKLVELEIRGLVERIPGGLYIRLYNG